VEEMRFWQTSEKSPVSLEGVDDLSQRESSPFQFSDRTGAEHDGQNLNNLVADQILFGSANLAYDILSQAESEVLRETYALF
jgi:hypothetical protein